MYNRFQLAKKYLHYWFNASNGKGHGIHSPFVFGFIKNVLRDKKKYDSSIETRRKFLLKDHRVIEVEDFGAGSAVIKSNKRKINDIASSSLKSKKYAWLLFRIVNQYHPQNIVELGTSFGITTSYLANGNPDAKIFTCEGSSSIANIARQTFNELKLNNIELIEGDFAKTLPSVLSTLKTIDLAFVDGNHSKEPTLDYFSKLLNYSTSSTILIFDDIHWSKEMEEAWEIISQHPAITLTIDLFFIGIAFLNPDINHKQHFIIRF